jgi:hypothetical protein
MSSFSSQGALIPISEALDGCPPSFLLLTCQNSDQATAFTGVKQTYTDLRHSLLCFFSGLPLPTHIDKKYQSALRLQLAIYIRLYEVLSHGWEYLNLPPEATPGSLIEEIIKREAIFIFKQSQARFKTFSPKTFCEDERFVRSLENLVNSGKSLSLIQIKRAKALIAKGKSQRVEEELQSLKDQCLYCLENVSPMPPELRLALKTYEIAVREIEDHVLSCFHPRKKVKGYQTVKGRRVETS